MPEPERIDRRRAALIAYDVCRRALDVEPQQVVLGQAEAADRRLRFYPAVRAMPVVSMQPEREFFGAPIRGGIGLGVGPFA